ncbi:MAG: tail fiber domain-containing protein [bacterium]|nr:tail fiber domain-containing protein [bacterium]
MKKIILFFSLFLASNIFAEGFNGIRDSKVRKDLASEIIAVRISTDTLISIDNDIKISTGIILSSMTATYVSKLDYASSSSTFINRFLDISSGNILTPYTIFYGSMTETERLFNLTLSSFGIVEGQYLNKTATDTAQGIILNGSLISKGTENSYLMGNVGIGTTSPTAHVDIQGIAATWLRIGAPTINTSGVILNQNGVDKWYLYNDANVNFIIEPNTGGASKFAILQNNGNVGIGTTNPEHKLEIIGDLANTGMLWSTGTYNAQTGVTTRALLVDNNGLIGNVTSSRRFKNNITDMENTDWFYNLRPVNFTYKKDNTNTKQYGLIAEEVADINNSFITYEMKTETETYKIDKSTETKIRKFYEENKLQPETVEYQRFIPVLIKICQEQKTLINEMSTEMLNLNKRISILENK